MDEAKRLGFTSATIKNDDNTLLEKYSKEYEKYSKEYREVLGQYLYLVERIRLIVRMKEYWGENSVLVPFDDFVKICDKYGLTCGCFDEYTGYVPEDRLKSIANIQYKLSEIDAYWIIKIRKFHRITNATPSHLKEHKKRNEAYKRFCSIFPFCEYDEFIPGVELRKEETSLFICAPKKYMKNVEVPIIDYTDPFICAYTDYGVMILERWDLEAQDEVIQSHDETQSEILRICKRLLNQLKE